MCRVTTGEKERQAPSTTLRSVEKKLQPQDFEWVAQVSKVSPGPPTHNSAFI
jgi:hypothetical protein